MNFLKTSTKRNLENVVQRSLRTDRARECIFTVRGGTNFEIFSAHRQPWWRLQLYPQKTLDTSLVGHIHNFDS